MPVATMRRLSGLTALFALALFLPRITAAQVVDTLQRDTSGVVPVVRVQPGDSIRTVQRRAMFARPPLSPGRAFLISFAIPGLAQARLDRTTSGALYAMVEMASIAMLRRSLADVREVQRQRTDTIPGDFTVDPGTGAVTPGIGVTPRFEEGLERTRKLHVEDWTAAIIFNHLISASDGFVAAQLWDVPTRVSLVPTAQGGLMLAVSVRW